MHQFIKIAIHIALPLGAYLAAYAFVLSPSPAWWFGPEARHVWHLAIIYTTIAALVEVVSRTERSSWRFVSILDGFALVRSTILTTVVFVFVVFVLVRAENLPRSVLLITGLFHLGGLASVRLLRRTAHERSILRAVAPLLHRTPAGRARLLLVGDLSVADAFLRELARDSGPAHEPVAILGLKPDDRGRAVRDVMVRGTAADLERTVQAFDVANRSIEAILFLSPPDVIQSVSADTLGALKARGMSLLRLPAMSEINAQRGSLPEALRELSVEELLARPSVRLDLTGIHHLINDKTVLVTGAAGSIGSEICRQVAAFGCGRLIMVDHSEFGLFRIGREIEEAHPALPRVQRLCDVRDAQRIKACVRSASPDIIFHAAALKHVTMVENQPTEGVLTNVIGTANVAEAALAAQASQMVMISTDKAVDPNNIMGATKRLAEAVVRGFHGRSRTAFSVVRFGNVLGSTGSVVPIFQEQIERGGPVTVTDPAVERYFMTIPEAVQLVLHATAESGSRDLSQPSVFVLDMGSPVKILDLARNMIALQGLSVGRDIEIKFTGLRPGEKLTEALIDTNERVLNRLPSVIEVVDQGRAAFLTPSQVHELEGIARSGDDEAMRDVIYAHVNRLRNAGFALAAG